jgi:sulfate transport system substrate-binding protein
MPLFLFSNRIRRFMAVSVAAGLGAALLIWTLWPWLPMGKDSHPRTIVLYGFSILEPTITKSLFPAFRKKWQAETGQDVELISSFAGSGTVTNQLIMGVPAEIAILSTELDAQRLREAGVVTGETWKGLPHGGVINRTPFVIVTRQGNPKGIHDFSDLTKPGVGIIHPDPLTSGAANWSILAEYGAAMAQPGATPADGQALLLGIWRNVLSLAGSGRAARTQFDSGFGDALITYEQDGLSSSSGDGPAHELIYPRSTIMSEHTLVVIDRNISGEERALIRAFTDFMWSEEGQRLFVECGFRSVNESLNGGNPEFGDIPVPFLVSDFGGWDRAKREIIDEVWKNKVLKEVNR